MLPKRQHEAKKRLGERRRNANAENLAGPPPKEDHDFSLEGIGGYSALRND